jgi:hypothetical protein
MDECLNCFNKVTQVHEMVLGPTHLNQRKKHHAIAVQADNVSDIPDMESLFADGVNTVQVCSSSGLS